MTKIFTSGLMNKTITVLYFELICQLYNEIIANIVRDNKSFVEVNRIRLLEHK